MVRLPEWSVHAPCELLRSGPGAGRRPPKGSCGREPGASDWSEQSRDHDVSGVLLPLRWASSCRSVRIGVLGLRQRLVGSQRFGGVPHVQDVWFGVISAASPITSEVSGRALGAAVGPKVKTPGYARAALVLRLRTLVRSSCLMHWYSLFWHRAHGQRSSHLRLAFWQRRHADCTCPHSQDNY